MAICAICQQLATREQGIALSGSEVFHQECVRRHGTANSVLNRLKTKLAELELFSVREIETIRQRASVLEDEVRTLRRAADKSKGDRENAQRAQQDLALRKIELDGVRSELRRAREAHKLLKEDFERMAADRDAARREAALHQTLAGQHVVAHVQADVTAVGQDDRDATEIRFSLLELDDSK